MQQQRPSIVIVSPALSDANNGNWQTARRWQSMLSERFSVRIVKEWTPATTAPGDAAMIALHARRSAASIRAWIQHHGTKAVSNAAQPCANLAVILTGTDLYRDIQSDAQAQHSLAVAGQLVVLQAQGVNALPAHLQDRTRVILQSSTGMPALQKSDRTLRCIAVGHLRAEKHPDTLMHAAGDLADVKGLRIDHLGAALDDTLAQLAMTTAQQHPHYRWLGARPHAETRRRIQRAHVLIHPSRMEGGAHVIMEAVTSGTVVLASRIDGNVGMLGDDYPGYFPVGDFHALAQQVRQLRAEQQQPVNARSLMTQLQQHCTQRAALFSPQREQQALTELATDLLSRKL